MGKKKVLKKKQRGSAARNGGFVGLVGGGILQGGNAHLRVLEKPSRSSEMRLPRRGIKDREATNGGGQTV